MTNPKGAWFERLMANYFSRVIEGELPAGAEHDIDRQVKTGTRDRGDIRGVRVHGRKVVVEAKNTARPKIATALKEAEIERGNCDALAGVVVAKRTGKGKPEDQMVYMTAKDFMAIITGDRPE